MVNQMNPLVLKLLLLKQILETLDLLILVALPS